MNKEVKVYFKDSKGEKKTPYFSSKTGQCINNEQIELNRKIISLINEGKSEEEIRYIQREWKKLENKDSLDGTEELYAQVGKPEEKIFDSYATKVLIDCVLWTKEYFKHISETEGEKELTKKAREELRKGMWIERSNGIKTRHKLTVSEVPKDIIKSKDKNQSLIESRKQRDILNYYAIKAFQYCIDGTNKPPEHFRRGEIHSLIINETLLITLRSFYLRFQVLLISIVSMTLKNLL